MHGQQSRFRHLMYAALAAAIIFGALEIGLRLAGFRYEGFFNCPSWWTRCSQNFIFLGDPERFWKLRPLANADLDPARRDTQAINAAGFRDHDQPIEKAPGELRILSMGDSCTFGDGVANWEAYPKVLETMIKTAFPDKRFSVINAGVPGYTTYQIKTFLTGELLKYKPDVLTVYVGFNDSIPASGKPDKDYAVSSRRINEVRQTLNHSRLYQLLNKIISVGKRGTTPKDPTPFPSTGEEWPTRVSVEDFKKNLCEFDRLGQENGFKVIVMTLPHSFAKEPDFNGPIRAAAQECKIEMIDLWEIMKDKQSNGPNLYNPDGGHPNPLGDRIIARALFEKLQQMNLLPNGPAPDLPSLDPATFEPVAKTAEQKNVAY